MTLMVALGWTVGIEKSIHREMRRADAWKKEILGFNLVNVRPPRNRARLTMWIIVAIYIS